MTDKSSQDRSFWPSTATGRLHFHDIWNRAKAGNISELEAEEQQLAKRVESWRFSAGMLIFHGRPLFSREI